MFYEYAHKFFYKFLSHIKNFHNKLSENFHKTKKTSRNIYYVANQKD